MSKKNSYVCESCHTESFKWHGRCPLCHEWNSLISIDSYKKSKKLNQTRCFKLAAVETTKEAFIDLALEEFKRVLGKGISHSSLTLIGGPPGVGKSTLLLEVSRSLKEEYKVLYVSAEETVEQVASRARRIGFDTENFYLCHELIWENIVLQINELKPDLVVLDSVQTISLQELPGAPGTTTMIKELTLSVLEHLKKNQYSCLLVGHITKNGSLAGPKHLEHMVDTVLHFNGEQESDIRYLTCSKNRFGPVDEIGCFRMSSQGLEEYTGFESELFNKQIAQGSSLSLVNTGKRILPVEIQSLVFSDKNQRLIKSVGVDNNRLFLILGILTNYLKLNFDELNVFIAASQSFDLDTRRSDLAIAASLLSSYKGKKMNGSYIFWGEVSLDGKVKNPDLKKILKKLCPSVPKTLIVDKKNSLSYDLETKHLQLKGIDHISELPEIIL